MSRREEILAEISDVRALHFVAGALTEINTQRLASLRVGYAHKRRFFEDLHALYVELRSQLKRADAHDIYDVSKNTAGETQVRRPYHVVLTSNQRFAGGLNRGVFEMFLNGVQQQGGDALVIGRTGKMLIESGPLSGRSQAMVFSRDIPTSGEIKTLLTRVGDASPVYVYFPAFENLVTQVPRVTDIAGEIGEGLLKETERTTQRKSTSQEHGILNFIFEPELSQFVAFFEAEVKRFLLTSAFFEADLARTASRVVTLSQAEENAKELIRERRIELRKTVAALQNIHLLETFAGITQWRKLQENN